MKKTRYRYFAKVACLMLLLLPYKGSKAQKVITSESGFAKNYTYSKHYDKVSNTYYYLTRIKHKDKEGRLIKLRYGLAAKKEGEIAMDFADRTHSAVVFNASMGIKRMPPGVRQPVGIQIVAGKIVQDLPTRCYTLGITDNNELLAYKPGLRAQDILDAGTKNALTAFIPLIEDHKPVSEDLFKIAGNLIVKHPRQVVAQFDNLDILVLSCGGRGIDGDGMTAKDLMRILEGLNVKFAFNLDGGGSVSTVIDGKLITKKIDKNGTEDRPRPSFLYVKAN